MKRKVYQENSFKDITDLALNDFIKAAVQKYNIEVEAGIKLISEYQAMIPHILTNLRDCAYNNPILENENSK